MYLDVQVTQMLWVAAIDIESDWKGSCVERCITQNGSMSEKRWRRWVFSFNLERCQIEKNEFELQDVGMTVQCADFGYILTVFSREIATGYLTLHLLECFNQLSHLKPPEGKPRAYVVDWFLSRMCWSQLEGLIAQVWRGVVPVIM